MPEKRANLSLKKSPFQTLFETGPGQFFFALPMLRKRLVYVRVDSFLLSTKIGLTKDAWGKMDKGGLVVKRLGGSLLKSLSWKLPWGWVSFPLFHKRVQA